MRRKLLYICTILLLVSVAFIRSCSNFGCASFRQARINIDAAFDKNNVIPMVIIGSGPAGLSAGIYGVWSNIKLLVIQGPKPGGLLTETTAVENWLGSASILGPEIISNLENQIMGISDRYIKDTANKVQILEDTVSAIDFAHWPYQIQTDGGRHINALSIIFATGASPKMLGVPGENEYWKRGVTTCAVCDAGFFANMDVVVIGGGDSAIEQAMQLARHVKSVTILVRKDAMRASALMQERLKEFPTIKVLFNVQVKRILGDNKSVTGVELSNAQTKEISTLETRGVFLAIGHTPNSALVKDQVDVDHEGYIVVQGRTQKTSIPGFFAAGEIVDSTYRQAGYEAGLGVAAALDAVAFLNSIGFNPGISKKLEANYFKPEAPKRNKSEIQIINSADEFKREVEQSKGIVFADFYRDDCIHCKDLEPILHVMAEHFAGKVKFVKVDVDKDMSVARRLSIQGLPELIIYRDGNLIARHRGSISQKNLLMLINHILEGNSSVPDELRQSD